MLCNIILALQLHFQYLDFYSWKLMTSRDSGGAFLAEVWYCTSIWSAVAGYSVD